MADDLEDDTVDAADPLPRQRRPGPRGKPFQPGQSGNPNGPQSGRRHPAFAALDLIGQEGAEAVLRAVVAQATDGDMRAAEILLKRCWPERKGKPVRIDLPPMNTAADLVPAMAKVTTAVADGELSPDEGQAVAAMLDVQRRVIETRDLEARLRRIEEQEGTR